MSKPAPKEWRIVHMRGNDGRRFSVTVALAGLSRSEAAKRLSCARGAAKIGMRYYNRQKMV